MVSDVNISMLSVFPTTRDSINCILVRWKAWLAYIMVVSHGAYTSPDMSQVVSLVEDFRASFYPSSSSKTTHSVSNTGSNYVFCRFLKAFIHFPATDVAILVPSRSVSWYITLSFVLVRNPKPDHSKGRAHHF